MQWPDAALFAQAIQNPRSAFAEQSLQDLTPVLNRLGFPLVYCGNFASVFKLQRPDGRPLAIRCFLREVGDRQRRYSAIDAHLDGATAKSITQFDYDEGGILVNGKALPLVVMEWLEGFTLDQYILSNAATAEALRSLAVRWTELVTDLETAQIAHGDLQHGNILVSQGDLKLVDYDGMFVPALAGLRASERGHPGYQHPLRDEAFFNDRIDRFSELVIYGTLIALAERPTLKQRCTGDHLLFTAADFRSPKSSETFALLDGGGPEVRRIGQAIREACFCAPGMTPRLLDLVSAPAPSKLPSWMRADTLPEPTKVVIEGPRVVSGQPSHVGTRRVSEPAPAGYAATPAQVWKASLPQVAVPSPKPSRKFERKGFFGCMGYLTFGLLLSGTFANPQLALVILAVGALIAALINYEKPYTAVGSSTYRPVPYQRPTGGASTNIGALSGHIVASRIRNVYHRSTCEWARKMSYRNRLQFGSSAAARAAGYRPCRVCRP
jgi:hypothetical protein